MNRTDMIAMREELNEMQEQYKTAMRTYGKEIFNETCKDLFEKNPKLMSFGWHQYTPYFNDGDACEFRVNRDCFYVNGSDEYLDSWSFESWLEEDYKWKPNPEEFGFDTVQEMYNVIKDLNEVLGNFEDNDLLNLFDDHSRIVVNRDGTIDIEDYEHD